MSIYIYTTNCQPATHYVDRNIEPEMWLDCCDRSRFRTDCCRLLRWAKYVEVQVYYDGMRRWCIRGHGCKKGKR